MGRQYTPNLKLLMPDPDEPLTAGDLQRIFQADPVTLDTSIYALKDMVLALANQGYTPVSPVVLSGNALKVYIENASTQFDIPTLLAGLPAQTPLRITGFTMTLASVSELLDFYDKLDTFYGLDMNLQGLTKAQMHGTIKLTGANDTITVTGAQMASWTERYPSVTVIPQRIVNHVYYYNFDGSELLHTETVYDNANATYSAAPAMESTQSGYYYSFRGWSVSSHSATADAVLTAVTLDTSVYAAYAPWPLPVVTVTKRSPGQGEEATLNVSFGGWTLLSYTCQYTRAVTDDFYFDFGGGNGGASDENPTTTLTPGNGITVSDNTVTITPNFTPGSVTKSYLTFSKDGESADVNVSIFDV